MNMRCLIGHAQADKILALTNAAGCELEPIWATLLAKALEGKNVKDLLSNVGAGGGGPAVGAPSAGGGGGGAPAAAAAPAEEKKKEEEKEESDDDMVSVSPKRIRIRDAYHNVRALVSSTDLWSRIIHSHRLLLAMRCISPLHNTHLK
jgi:large subunit ribosomal protein LP1